MTLPRPQATITLDGQRLTSAQAGLSRLRLDLGFDTHDRAQLLLWPNSKLASAVPGKTLQIGLQTEPPPQGLLAQASALAGLGGGDADALWTGTVESVQTGARQVRIDGLASTAALSRQRRSATWAAQSVGDVVRDLAGELESEVEIDLDLPNYSIDNRQPVWAHLRELARLTGASLSGTAAGGLRFILAARQSATIELRYGADLIDWRLNRVEPPPAAPAAEYAAASTAGNDKWHWLAHDPVGAGAGDTRVAAIFRTRAAADHYSEAEQTRSQRGALRGVVWLTGRPALRPGAVVELTGLPEGDSGPLRVRQVTHQLDGDSGFVTALSVEAGSGGSGLGGLF